MKSGCKIMAFRLNSRPQIGQRQPQTGQSVFFLHFPFLQKNKKLYICSRKKQSMNKMKLKTIVLLLMMGICSTTISAHYYNNVRVRDNSPIHCVVQDETNLVWLGTEHGLYLYDGYRCIPRHTAGERLRSTI